MMIIHRVVAVGLLLGLAAPVGATPTSTRSLADAQKLSKKGDHAGAAKILAQASDGDPKNAQVLSELGWQLFLASDLPRALQATQQAIAVATTDGLKAASYYNLGRIQEAMGKRDDAVAAYVTSLGVRDSETVLQRLAKLDPAKAAALDPNAPKLLDGPFASIEAWCAGQKNTCHLPLGESGNLIHGPHQVVAPLPPYKAVQAFVVEQSEDSLTGDCAVAIQLAAGWYVGRVVPECREGAMFRRPTAYEMTTKRVPTQANPIVDWLLQVEVSMRNHQMEWVDKDPESHGVTCCIGPSGKPSCGELIGYGKSVSFP